MEAGPEGLGKKNLEYGLDDQLQKGPVGIWIIICLNPKTRFDSAFIVALLQQFSKIGIEVKTAPITDGSILNKID